MTRSFFAAAAVALVLSGPAFAQSGGGGNGGGGNGSDVRANVTGPEAPKPMPRMGRPMMSHGQRGANADRSADDLNAKELATIQGNQTTTTKP